MGGVLFTGYLLVLGSYNFILLVALFPRRMRGGLALWQGEWRKLGGGRCVMPGLLLACGA